jgi:hypothetical protein
VPDRLSSRTINGETRSRAQAQDHLLYQRVIQWPRLMHLRVTGIPDHDVTNRVMRDLSGPWPTTRRRPPAGHLPSRTPMIHRHNARRERFRPTMNSCCAPGGIPRSRSSNHSIFGGALPAIGAALPHSLTANGPARRGSARLLSDYLHAGPHEWPPAFTRFDITNGAAEADGASPHYRIEQGKVLGK